MPRIQLVLSGAEASLVDQMAALTPMKRTDVIKNALTVYHWVLRQAITAARVVSRKPTGEGVALETAERAMVEGQGHVLSPAELHILVRKPASSKDPGEAARLKERLTRGFYGI